MKHSTFTLALGLTVSVTVSSIVTSSARAQTVTTTRVQRLEISEVSAHKMTLFAPQAGGHQQLRFPLCSSDGLFLTSSATVSQTIGAGLSVSGTLSLPDLSSGILQVAANHEVSSGPVNLSNSTHITGVLPVENGGMGSATVNANSFFAGPVSGVPGAPTWRQLTAADMPSGLGGNGFTQTLGVLHLGGALSSDVTLTGSGAEDFTLSGVDNLSMTGVTSNFSGSSATNLGVSNGVSITTIKGQQVQFEGETDDGSEFIFDFPDPIVGDVTYTFPTAGGEIVTTNTISTVIGSNAILNQNTVNQAANFRISGTGQMPVVQGGSLSNSFLTLQATSASGTNGADDAMLFNVGNNGAIEAIRIGHDGQVTIPNANITGGSITGINITTTNLDVTGSLTIGGGAAITQVLTATADLNFASLLLIIYDDETISVPGAALGDLVVIGAPATAMAGGMSYFGWVSSADQVTIRGSAAGLIVDPPLATFRVTVIKH